LRMAGALILLIFAWRPCRTSWLIVGTETRLLSFPVLGQSRFATPPRA
jgi:hypothetical protein